MPGIFKKLSPNRPRTWELDIEGKGLECEESFGITDLTLSWWGRDEIKILTLCIRFFFK